MKKVDLNWCGLVGITIAIKCFKHIPFFLFGMVEGGGGGGLLSFKKNSFSLFFLSAAPGFNQLLAIDSAPVLCGVSVSTGVTSQRK